LESDNLPKRIAFVGGGYISFEIAHIAARAGAHVTILHRTNKPLDQFDPDLVNQLVLRTRELGVYVKLETAVKGIVRTTSGLVVQASSYDNNEERTIEADMVVHGAGRVPDIEGVDIPSAGIDYEPKKRYKSQ
jgi:glutathione reductase (NADPH)